MPKMTVTAHRIYTTLNILLLVCLNSRADKSHFDKLTGRNRLSVSEVSFIISVLEEDNHCCVGAYVHKSWILTTAVCAIYIHEDQTRLHITAGDIHKPYLEDDDGEPTGAVIVTVHDKFKARNKRDNIALVEITRSYDFSLDSPIIKIFKKTEISDEKCFLYGWLEEAGKMAEDDTGTYIIKSKWEFFPIYECVKRLNKSGVTGQTFFIDQMVCGKAEKCISDDGAPLVCNRRLFGILSAADCSVSIIMKLSHYKSWIDSYLNRDLRFTENSANEYEKNLFFYLTTFCIIAITNVLLGLREYNRPFHH